MWPGNTADVTSLIPAVERLRKRFSITRVCVVAGATIPSRYSPLRDAMLAWAIILRAADRLFPAG